MLIVAPVGAEWTAQCAPQSSHCQIVCSFLLGEAAVSNRDESTNTEDRHGAAFSRRSGTPEVQCVAVKPGARVALGGASAIYDESVLDAPEEVRLNRKPNPHISFGSERHLCLGAPHAGLIARTLLTPWWTGYGLREAPSKTVETPAGARDGGVRKREERAAGLRGRSGLAPGAGLKR